MRFLVLSSALLLVAAAPRAGAMEVVSDGVYKGTVADYKVGKTTYLGAKDVGAVYGAQVYWFPVSGRLRLSLRGRQLELLVGSDTAALDGKRIPLGAQVILRGSEAFVPSSLLSSREFSAWTGIKAEWGAGNRVLSVERDANVGPLRWSSHARHTRLVLELEDRLSYKTAGRGGQGVDVVIPMGVVAAPRTERIEDGRVVSASLAREAGQARLSLKLAVPGLRWKAREIRDPRRLVLDVYSGDEPPPLEPAKTSSAGFAGAAVSSGAAAGAAPAVAVDRKFRLVIDPGHGGKDSGAVGRKGTLEKDVVLAVGRSLAKRLEEDDRIEVLMTRGEDYFVPLAERSKAANDFHADLFVSIHCNSSPKKADTGFEIYFVSEKATDPEAQRLADFENSVLELEGKSLEEEEAAIILRALSRTEFMNEAARFAEVLAKSLAKRVDVADRGVKQAGFYVLRGTDSPAVLLEIAYLSHRKDEARLGSKSFRKKVVEGLYQGIDAFVKQWEEPR